MLVARRLQRQPRDIPRSPLAAATALEHHRGTGETRRRVQGRQGGRASMQDDTQPALVSEDIMFFRHCTLIVAASALALGASAAMAQTAAPAKTPTPQQQRMTECSAANKGKTGDAYKSAMSACLKGEQPAAKLTPQQQKMKDCNAEASKQSLKGDKRKAFMSTCLKG